MMAIVRCSFCGRSQNDAPRLVATEAGTAAICAECVEAVAAVLATADDEPAIDLTPLGREVVARIGGEARG